MTDKKIGDLPEIDYADLMPEDEFVIVDYNTDITKKVKYAGLAKLLNVNSVLKYGADPTGVADSTAAFVACLAQNHTAYVPEGDFIVGDLALDSQKIAGNGTLKRKVGSGYCVIMQGDEAVIEGITFDTHQSAVNGESEIKLDDSANYPAVRRCRFTGTLYSVVSADDNGIDDTSLTYTNPVNGFVFEGNVVKGSYSRHLYLHSVDNIRIVNNTFKGSKRDCLRLRQATSKCLISGNTFDDIGEEYPDIVERPKNWLSGVAFTLGAEVSVPPFGIYRCIVATSTIGANPATGGAAEWTNIAPGYFETKDILDAFWSGVELIITNNVVNKCASYGFDIKGAEPNGAYVSGKVIIANNLIQNCFGVGINLSNAQLLNDSSFRYTAQFIIQGNVFSGNNRERFDVSESPVKVRQGIRSVIIANNIFEKNYARAISVLNSSEDALINKDISIFGNQIYSNGIPGNAGSIGINVAPVDGLILKDNTINNLTTIEEYNISATGTSTADQTIVFPAIGNAGGTISVDILNGDSASTIIFKITDALRNDAAYDVEYDSTPNTRYFTNIREDLGVQAYDVDATAQLRFTSKLPGAQGNIYSVIIDEQGSAVPLYPGADNFIYDDGTKTLTIETRSSTKPFHLLTAFTSNASTEIKDLFQVALEGATSSDASSQSVLTDSTMALAGGLGGEGVYFDARLENHFTPAALALSGVTVELTRDPLASNSVQVTAINLKDYEVVGSTTFRAPKLSYIIKDNSVAGNIATGRFSIMLNNAEVPALIAYVDSTNINSTTVVTTQARTFFSGGADSNGSNQLNVQAYLISQGMTFRARLSGARGNNISFTIEQQITADQPLRFIIAPAYLGGKEMILRLPTDGAGDPVDVTVSEAEDFIKQRIGQALLGYEDNYIGLTRPAKEDILGPPDLLEMRTGISTTGDIEVFRGGVPLSLGAEVGTLKTTVSGHTSSIGTNTSNIATNTSNIATNTGNISANAAAILALQNMDYNDPEVGFNLFEGWNSQTAAGNLTWRLTANSGTNGMNVSTSLGKEQGIMRLDTAASATSAPTVDLGHGSGFIISNTAMLMQTKLQVQTLSTITERFLDRFGFLNSNTSAAPTNGIWLEYDESTSPNWFLVTMAASTSTRTDTGVAVTTAWIKVKFIITNATSVAAYINNTLVATNTTNIPSGTSAALPFAYQKIKSAGTTARVTFVDYWRLKVVY